MECFNVGQHLWSMII